MSQTTQEERKAWMQSDGDHLNRRAVFRLLQDFSELEAELSTLREKLGEAKKRTLDLSLLLRRMLVRLAKREMDAGDDKLSAQVWEYLRKHELAGGVLRTDAFSGEEQS